jgi:hypothetical protein
MGLSRTKISNGPSRSSDCVTIDFNLSDTGYNANDQFGLGHTPQQTTWTKNTTSGIVNHVADVFANEEGAADSDGSAALVVTRDGALWVAGYNGVWGAGVRRCECTDTVGEGHRDWARRLREERFVLFWRG